MTRIALIFSIVGSLLVGILVLVTTPARADDLNQVTCLTFSGPIELPTVALPAGSYLFKLPNGDNDRHIVQVFSSDGKQVLGTFLTIPEERLQWSDKTVVTFAETAAGVPADRGDVTVGPDDPRKLSVTLPALASGRYVVRYRALSVDGHVVESSFVFSVK